MTAEFEAAKAARLGNFREAIRSLFDSGAVDPAKNPTYFVDCIEAWTAQGVLAGALADDARLRDAVLDVFRLARVSPPDVVVRMCAAPEPQVGVAVFPVAVMDGREHHGALRAIEVSMEERVAAHPPTDAGFLDTVEEARKLVLARCGRDVRVRVQAARWRVLPDLPSNASLCDGSVALAALIAFTSFAVEAPVPASCAFTGVLRERQLGSPAMRSASAKRSALWERSSITTLFWPGFSGDAPEVVAEVRLERISADVFSIAWPELAMKLEGSAPPRKLPVSRRLAAGAVGVLLLSLLAAARWRAHQAAEEAESSVAPVAQSASLSAQVGAPAPTVDPRAAYALRCEALVRHLEQGALTADDRATITAGEPGVEQRPETAVAAVRLAERIAQRSLFATDLSLEPPLPCSATMKPILVDAIGRSANAWGTLADASLLAPRVTEWLKDGSLVLSDVARKALTRNTEARATGAAQATTSAVLTVSSAFGLCSLAETATGHAPPKCVALRARLVKLQEQEARAEQARLAAEEREATRGSASEEASMKTCKARCNPASVPGWEATVTRWCMDRCGPDVSCVQRCRTTSVNERRQACIEDCEVLGGELGSGKLFDDE